MTRLKKPVDSLLLRGVGLVSDSILGKLVKERERPVLPPSVFVAPGGGVWETEEILPLDSTLRVIIKGWYTPRSS